MIFEWEERGEGVLVTLKLVPKNIHAHDHCLKKVSLTFFELKISCYTEKQYHVHTSLLHERVK